MYTYKYSMYSCSHAYNYMSIYLWRKGMIANIYQIFYVTPIKNLSMAPYLILKLILNCCRLLLLLLPSQTTETETVYTHLPDTSLPPVARCRPTSTSTRWLHLASVPRISSAVCRSGPAGQRVARYGLVLPLTSEAPGVAVAAPRRFSFCRFRSWTLSRGRCVSLTSGCSTSRATRRTTTGPGRTSITSGDSCRKTRTPCRRSSLFCRRSRKRYVG